MCWGNWRSEQEAEFIREARQAAGGGEVRKTGEKHEAGVAMFPSPRACSSCSSIQRAPLRAVDGRGKPGGRAGWRGSRQKGKHCDRNEAVDRGRSIVALSTL